VLLRPAFERLLDSYLRARRDPPAECKAQQQDQTKEQRECDRHVRAVNGPRMHRYVKGGRGRWRTVEDGGGSRRSWTYIAAR